MTRSGRSRIVLGLAVMALVGCSGDDDPTSTVSPPVDTSESSADADGREPGSDSREPTDPAPESTPLRPGVVAFDGSVESLILSLPDARNFAEGVEDWLAAVPGQEGVFRNSRGITVFVPVDEGFPASVAAARFADPDTAAVTIGDHLLVGAFDDLTELGDSVTVAGGSEYAITDDGGTIGGRRVLRTETGTNGVVLVIDGPLGDG